MPGTTNKEANMPGNPIARNPLLRKGGAHQRGRSGERQIYGGILRSAVDEWFRDYAERSGNRSKR